MLGSLGIENAEDMVTAVREPERQNGFETSTHSFRRQSGCAFPSNKSLPSFIRERPKLFWPKNNQEISPDELLEHSDALSPLIYRDNLSRPPSNATVHAAACDDGNGNEDTLAVKITYMDGSPRERAEKEISILKSLNHCHIIAFVGSYITDEQFAILLYPVAKYNLWDFMRAVSHYNQGPLTTNNIPHKNVESLKSYFACLCQALLYLHNLPNPIRHRDIKPENILVDQFGTVILTDFDISKEYPKGHTITTGQTRCTVEYAAPEVVSGRDRDEKSDIFSLGCVFLEMITVILGENFFNLHQMIKSANEDRNIRIQYHKKRSEVQQWINHLKKNFSGVLGGEHHVDKPFCHERDKTRQDVFHPSVLDTISAMMSPIPSESVTLSVPQSIYSGPKDAPPSNFERMEPKTQNKELDPLRSNAEISSSKMGVNGNLDKNNRHTAGSGRQEPKIRIYNLLKKGTPVQYVNHATEIPGRSRIVFYSPRDKTSHPRLISKSEVSNYEGVILLLPHGNGVKYQILDGNVNLWKSLKWHTNIMRGLGLAVTRS
ncbi:kinase-like protein [Patellaria atrata CBS 101060]|uniref:Kinase-like protein n=1 Tax=Patellaria atrata CBS 101060 TaxID=1346257 RepID=A0A9P4SDN2_9PEZI|nr:kinase-like protein [Patellaria atrata CBS 101060]